MYDSLHSPVVTSCLCYPQEADGFYFPEARKLTGFSRDGNYYNDGVLTTTLSSWVTEEPSITRGYTQPFPLNALVLVGSASITIFDMDTPSPEMWMIFYFADGYVFSSGIPTNNLWFRPASCYWENGVLGVKMMPDDGSPNDTVSLLEINFVTDSVQILSSKT